MTDCYCYIYYIALCAAYRCIIAANKCNFILIANSSFRIANAKNQSCLRISSREKIQFYTEVKIRIICAVF